MNIKPITNYMRQNVAKCVVMPTDSSLGVDVTERVFLNKADEVVAASISYKSKDANHKVVKTMLETLNGLFKFTEHDIDIVKLDKFKGKRNFKFPYKVSSKVAHSSDNGKVQRRLFMITDGVSFKKTDSDGVMIYHKNKGFKTQKHSIESSSQETDFNLLF